MIREQNGQITASQLCSLLALEMFGLVTLFLPDLLSRQLASDAPVGLAFGILLCFLYVLYAGWFWRNTKGALWEKNVKRNLFEEALVILFFMQCVFLAIFTLNMAAELVQDFLLPDTGRFPILFMFYLVSMVGAYKGVECRGRMAEWIGVIILVILTVFLFLSLRNVNLNQFETLFLHGPDKILRGSYDALILFESISFGLFAASGLNKKERLGGTMKKSLAIAGAFSLFLLLVLIGTFGGNYLANMEWPVIRLLRNIMKRGHFFSRMDILLLGIWLVSLFFLVSGGLLYSSKLLETELDCRREYYVKPILFLIVLILSWLFESAINSYYIYRNYMFYIGTPLIIVLMAGAVFWERKRGYVRN